MTYTNMIYWLKNPGSSSQQWFCTLGLRCSMSGSDMTGVFIQIYFFKVPVEILQWKPHLNVWQVVEGSWIYVAEWPGESKWDVLPASEGDLTS